MLTQTSHGRSGFNANAVYALLVLCVFRDNFSREFSQKAKELMPLPPEYLASMALDASSRARERLEAVPPTGDGDESLEDAISALGEFVELSASKVMDGCLITYAP